MKKKEIIGYVQTAVMVLLFVLMLVLCGLYIRFAETVDDGSLPDFPESEIMLLSKDAEASSASGQRLISPYFIGISSENFMYAQTFASEHSEEIWQSFTDVLEGSVSGSSERIVNRYDNDKSSYLENLYSSKESYFYVKLTRAMEYSVICSVLLDTYMPMPQNPDFKISDMFLLEGDAGEAYITAVSPDGEVLKIHSSKKIEFNNDLILSYNNTETRNFEFIKIQKNIENGQNGYFPVFRHPITAPTVGQIDFLQEFNISEDGDDALDFMAIFGMNSDNVKSYRTADNDIVYVEDTVRLSISDNGRIEYVPGEEGTHISRLSEGYKADEYGFAHLAKTATEIAGKINEKLSGYAARLTLSDVVYRDGKCEFYFDYSVDALPVKNREAYGMKLEFAGDCLTYAQVNVDLYYYLGEQKTEMSQKTAYAMLKDKLYGSAGYFGAEYSFVSDEEGNETGIIKWTIRTQTEDEE